MRLISIVLVTALSTSCSIAFQDTVRSNSFDCSTSYGWPVADLALGASMAYVASTGIGGNTIDGQPGYVLPAEVLAGTFIASAAIGAYRAHHCAVYREDPAVIAQINAERERIAEAQARGAAEAQAAAQAQAAACAAQGGCSVGDQTDQAPDQAPDQTPDVAQADQAACPDGQELGGPFNDTCESCPDGQLLGGQSHNECYTCPQGASIGGFANSECVCPDGTSSNGSACVAPGGQVAAPRHHHRHTQQQQQQVEQPYNNQLHLTCNGRLLVDQAFSTKRACLDFAASHKYTCSGLELPIGC